MAQSNFIQNTPFQDTYTIYITTPTLYQSGHLNTHTHLCTYIHAACNKCRFQKKKKNAWAADDGDNNAACAACNLRVPCCYHWQEHLFSSCYSVASHFMVWSLLNANLLDAWWPCRTLADVLAMVCCASKLALKNPPWGEWEPGYYDTLSLTADSINHGLHHFKKKKKKVGE